MGREAEFFDHRAASTKSTRASGRDRGRRHLTAHTEPSNSTAYRPARSGLPLCYASSNPIWAANSRTSAAYDGLARLTSERTKVAHDAFVLEVLGADPF